MNANRCRISACFTGGYYNPAVSEVTPIEYRYGETLATEDLPDKLRIVVSKRTPLHSSRVPYPRAVLIVNGANRNVSTMPDEATLETMRQRVLCVGFGAESRPSIELLPVVPGDATRELPGTQFLWLAPGAVAWLEPKHDGVEVMTVIQFFPGGE